MTFRGVRNAPIPNYLVWFGDADQRALPEGVCNNFAFMVVKPSVPGDLFSG